MKLSLKCSYSGMELKQTKTSKPYYLLTVIQDNREIKVFVFDDKSLKVNLQELLPGTKLEIVYNCIFRNNTNNLYVSEINSCQN